MQIKFFSRPSFYADLIFDQALARPLIISERGVLRRPFRAAAIEKKNEGRNPCAALNGRRQQQRKGSINAAALEQRAASQRPPVLRAFVVVVLALHSSAGVAVSLPLVVVLGTPLRDWLADPQHGALLIITWPPRGARLPGRERHTMLNERES